MSCMSLAGEAIWFYSWIEHVQMPYFDPTSMIGKLFNLKRSESYVYNLNDFRNISARGMTV